MTGSGVVCRALQPLERAPHVQPDRSEVASVRPAFASSPQRVYDRGFRFGGRHRRSRSGLRWSAIAR